MCEPLSLSVSVETPSFQQEDKWGTEAAVGPHGRAVEEVNDPPEGRHTPQSRCLVSQTDLLV